MTFPSDISFKAALAGCVLLLFTGHLFAAQVNGSVAFSGARTDGHRELSGAVIWLEPPAPLPVPPIRTRMLQKNKTFIPHVLAVPVGSTVDFPNLDPIFHNAFSNFNGQIFDVGLYPPGKSRPVVFRRAGVVRVFCNIHSMMSAVIAVVDSPYYAVTDGEGRYSIAGVPAGEYRLHVYYERATPATLAALVRTVEVRPSETLLPPIGISLTGYIAIPHSNKFGTPYPRDADGGNYSIAQ